MADPTVPNVDDSGAARDRGSDTRTPLWVWVVGIVVLGTSLAMLVSMTVPLILGGMDAGGH